MKKRILVTAGNTWAPIDEVRVLTNIFSGETGLLISFYLAKRGFKVKLILADARISLKKFRHKNLKIVRAITYKKFYKQVQKEVSEKKYLAIVHAAAVSDFGLKKQLKGKVSSKKALKLKLKPTKKISLKIKKWAPEIKLVTFKLEAHKKKRKLLKIALKNKEKAKADLIVANQLPFGKKHTFYLIKSKEKYKKIVGKKPLAKKISQIFKKEL